MYAGKNLDKAIMQAQANADYFDLCYLVFLDTSGNVRIEHCPAPNHIILTGTSKIVYPTAKGL
jgi:hypothetical protein